MPEKPRMHAFIDETYAVKGKASAVSFYVISVAVIPSHFLSVTRTRLVELIGDTYFHATECLRSSYGQRRLLNLLQGLPEQVRLPFTVFQPVLKGDRDGEATRAETIRRAVGQLRLAFEEDLEIVYEARRPGAQQQADLRTANGVKRMFGEVDMRPRSPSQENLLWIPDAAATAIRQRLIWGNTRFMEPIEERASVTYWTDQAG